MELIRKTLVLILFYLWKKIRKLGSCSRRDILSTSILFFFSTKYSFYSTISISTILYFYSTICFSTIFFFPVIVQYLRQWLSRKCVCCFMLDNARPDTRQRPTTPDSQHFLKKYCAEGTPAHRGIDLYNQVNSTSQSKIIMWGALAAALLLFFRKKIFLRF